MKKITQIISATAIALVVGLTTFTGATAAPFVPAQVQSTSDVQPTQYRHDNEKPRWKKHQDRRHDRAERRHDRRHDRLERRAERRGYWRGHRGYREYRRGYRRHTDGYYYAPGVFQIIIR